MTTEDQMMLTGLRQILKDYMSPSDLDSFANMVVNIGHDRLFRNMMDFIRYFQFEGCLFLLNTHTDNFLNLYISYSDKYIYSYTSIGIVWRLVILSVLKSKFYNVTGFQDFFEQLRVFLTKAGKAKWTVAEFDQKLTSMMQEIGFDFTCPPPSTMWAFHGEIAKSFKEKYGVFINDINCYMIIIPFQFKLDSVQMDFDDPILSKGFP